MPVAVFGIASLRSRDGDHRQRMRRKASCILDPDKRPGILSAADGIGRTTATSGLGQIPASRLSCRMTSYFALQERTCRDHCGMTIA